MGCLNCTQFQDGKKCIFDLHFAAFINQEWFVSRLFGNTLWLFALGYYCYITFLGYSCKSNYRNVLLVSNELNFANSNK